MALKTAVMACSVSESRTNSIPTRISRDIIRRRVLDLAVEANIHAASVAGEVHGHGPAHQLGGIGVIKADPETEHGDVDDPAVMPPGGVLSGELVRGGPACRLAMFTAAILHEEPSVLAPTGACLRPCPGRCG